MVSYGKQNTASFAGRSHLKCHHLKKDCKAFWDVARIDFCTKAFVVLKSCVVSNQLFLKVAL